MVEHCDRRGQTPALGGTSVPLLPECRLKRRVGSQRERSRSLIGKEMKRHGRHPGLCGIGCGTGRTWGADGSCPTQVGWDTTEAGQSLTSVASGWAKAWRRQDRLTLAPRMECSSSDSPPRRMRTLTVMADSQIAGKALSLRPRSSGINLFQEVETHLAVPWIWLGEGLRTGQAET
jgi:hypothetical protein